MRRRIYLCSLLIMMLLLTGCGLQKNEEYYTVYYTNVSGTRLMEVGYEPVAQNFDEMMKELIGQLASAPNNYFSALPAEVKYKGYERGIDALRIDFSKEYYNLSNTEAQERGDLFGKVGSAVHHRQQDTVYLELGIDLPLYLVYRGEQLFQPFGRQILRLNGNDNPVCSGQRIDCEHPKGGLAVDEDMGVLPLQRVQILPQDSLTAHGIYQGYLHTG